MSNFTNKLHRKSHLNMGHNRIVWSLWPLVWWCQYNLHGTIHHTCHNSWENQKIPLGFQFSEYTAPVTQGLSFHWFILCGKISWIRLSVNRCSLWKDKEVHTVLESPILGVDQSLALLQAKIKHFYSNNYPLQNEHTFITLVTTAEKDPFRVSIFWIHCTRNPEIWHLHHKSSNIRCPADAVNTIIFLKFVILRRSKLGWVSKWACKHCCLFLCHPKVAWQSRPGD